MVAPRTTTPETEGQEDGRDDATGRGGGRLRPQRARRRRHPRARRPAGDGPGVAADRRRRRADPRPRPGRRDHARHLLRRAPDGVGVPVLPAVRPAGPRRRAAGARGVLRAAAARRAGRGRVPGPGRGRSRGSASTVPAWRSLVGGDPAAAVAGGAGRQAVGAAGRPRARRLRFGLGVLEQGTRAWDRRFVDDVAPALLTGVAAHAITPLPSLAAAGTALLLGTLAHAEGGWPIPRGGSGAITAALVADLEAHGGTIRTDHRVRTEADLPRRALLRVRHHPAHPRRGARRPASRRGRGTRWTRSSTATRRPRSTSCSTARCRGPCPRSGGPAPCTSAARAPRWPARRTRSRAASTRTCR